MKDSNPKCTKAPKISRTPEVDPRVGNSGNQLCGLGSGFRFGVRVPGWEPAAGKNFAGHPDKGRSLAEGHDGQFGRF
jgi:hypothetical protein